MAGAVQRIPKGLLGLLQIKETGKNPSSLLDTIQPSYDLFQQYIADSMQNTYGLFNNPAFAAPTVLAVSITTANSGTSQSFSNPILAQVPQNNLWYIDTYATRAVIATAADTISFTGILTDLNFNTSWAMCTPYRDAVTANARLGWSASTRPFFALPGQIFQVSVDNCTSAGGIVVGCFLRGSALPV